MAALGRDRDAPSTQSTPNPHSGRCATTLDACQVPGTEDMKTMEAGVLQGLAGRDVAVTVRLIPGKEEQGRKLPVGSQDSSVSNTVLRGSEPPNVESGLFWNTPQA